MGLVTKDPVFLEKCYLSHVRPILEHCSPVWSPHLKKDIEALERVPKYFTRRVHGLKGCDYKERLFILNLESLEVRRLHFDLAMYFKIIHNLVDLNFDDFFVWSYGGVRMQGHNFKLELKKCNSNLLKFSFANRCVNC